MLRGRDHVGRGCSPGQLPGEHFNLVAQDFFLPVRLPGAALSGFGPPSGLNRAGESRDDLAPLTLDDGFQLDDAMTQSVCDRLRSRLKVLCRRPGSVLG